MFQGKERRKHKRIKRPFISRFQILNRKGESGVFPGWDMVTVQDLSAGGILFNYHDDLIEAVKLEFKINFPTLTKAVNCRGRVVRNEKLPGSSRVRVAARFTDINEREKQEIESFAEKAV